MVAHTMYEYHILPTCTARLSWVFLFDGKLFLVRNFVRKKCGFANRRTKEEKVLLFWCHSEIQLTSRSVAPLYSTVRCQVRFRLRRNKTKIFFLKSKMLISFNDWRLIKSFSPKSYIILFKNMPLSSKIMLCSAIFSAVFFPQAERKVTCLCHLRR